MFPSGTDAVPGATPLRINTEGTGQLSLSAGTGGAAVTAPPIAAAPTGTPVALTVTAPSEAKVGQEITLTMAMPAGAEGTNSTVQVTYDPSVLKPVGAAPPPDSIKAPDMAQIPVDVNASPAAGVPSQPVQMRFQVIAPAPTQTEIGLLVTRSNRPVNVPGTLSLSIVKP
jgi:general secretion pathway protein D